MSKKNPTVKLNKVKDKGPWTYEGDERKPLPYSKLDNVQLIFQAVDYKKCQKNTFRIGGGAWTIFKRLDGSYSKEALERYGRMCYSNLITNRLPEQKMEDIVIK